MAVELPKESVFFDKKTKKLNINIWPKQRMFLESDVDELFGGGAAGGGKSETLLNFCLTRRMKYANTLGIIFRRKFPDLEKSLILRSHRLFPRVGAKYNSSKHAWHFPNGAIQLFGFCFDDKTEVLTERGWSFFKDLKHDIKVATVNINHRIQYVRPVKYIQYPYSGKMVSVEQKNGVNFCVTPEHRLKVQRLNSGGKKYVWSSPYVERACELTGTRRIQRAFDSPHSYVHTVNFKRVKNGHGNITSCSVDSFAKFLGWYISEGCRTHRYGKSSYGKYDIRIHQKNFLGQLIDDVKSCGFNFNVVMPTHPDGVPFVVLHSKELHSWLAKCGDNAENKTIPRECFKWPKKALDNLLNGLLLGDGSKNVRTKRGGAYCIRSTSKQLADDIQELCLYLGKTATIGTVREGVRKLREKEYLCRKQYSVSISNRKYSDFRKKDVFESDYVGQVYCLSLPPYETLIVRRNGRAMISMNCENESDVYDHWSTEYHDMCFDELTSFTFYQFSYLTSRCRSAIPGVKALVRSASNPGQVGHVWVKQRYINPAKMQNKWFLPEEKKWLSFIPFGLEDNPSLTQNDPTYEARLKILGDKKYRALRFGDWEVFEGQFFDEWDSRPGQTVLVEPRIPAKHHIKFISMDWGYATHAAIHWWEVTPSGRVFIYREYYPSRRGPKDLAKDILELTPADEVIDYLSAPPELWGKEVEREGGGEPIADEMQEVFGRRMQMRKANNARVPGWMKLRQYLAKAPDGIPWLQISPVCKDTIRTVPALVHDEHKPEDLDGDGEDHCIAGDSLVETRNGFFKIKDLVSQEGEIWTTEGWKEFSNVRKTRQDIVYTVRLSTGRYLRLTKEHRILTLRGFIEVQYLLDTDKIVDIGSSDLIRSVTCELKLFQIRFKSLMESDITYVGRILEEVRKKVGENDFIEWFGNSIMEKFRLVFIFIIETITDVTIKFPTWNVQNSGSISLTMPQPLKQDNVVQETLLSTGYRKRERGTRLEKDGLGTVKMRNRLGEREKRKGNPVLDAVKNIGRGVLLVQSFVTLIVKCAFIERITPKLESIFWTTIEKGGIEDVYDLTVAGTQCFSVNGGVVVHNCADSIRYGAVSLSELPKMLITPQRTFSDAFFGTQNTRNDLYSGPEIPGRSGYGS